ncbi:zinc-binding alcohol dehydrogenase family protein [Aspergillus fijiensis CBS 313.89]|uniref:GroES-like protein n=1 Tax=Aspergillus fijiensis CBS 313.89 TaxID=1448319 RepID=A0A8G1VV03_9EURO|nr:GroES-like protein [Aspergillus fijiensis CBS 313.89]RAK72676.1 GroES-like protein [Aspergillus fijiensis CBS 313.89]
MQKAIVIDEVGKPAISINRPIPQAGPSELLLRVTATSLNPADQKTRDEGLFFKQSFQVLGHELAGEVIGIGKEAGPAKFQLGDHIFAQGNFIPGQVLTDSGALQQYAVVNASFAAKVQSAGLTDEEATTIPVCAIASFVALFHSTGMALPIPPASTPASQATSEFLDTAILIIGGGSNCGRFAIQFAKQVGFGRIITTASARNEIELKQLGATHIIDRHAGYEANIQQIRDITGDSLVHVFDTVNNAQEQKLGLAVLSNTKKGCLITLNRIPEVRFSAAEIGPKTAGYEHKMTFGFSALYPEISKLFWERVASWVKEGAMRPLPFSTIQGLEPTTVNKILDRYRDGQGQKVVINVRT